MRLWGLEGNVWDCGVGVVADVFRDEEGGSFPLRLVIRSYKVRYRGGLGLGCHDRVAEKGSAVLRCVSSFLKALSIAR